MATKSKVETDLVGQTFEIVRAFDAPRELVWRAWTEPALLAEWWGPRGFTNPVCEWNARPGAALHVVMRAQNGTEYPMAGEFREVAAPEKLVFTGGALDDAGHMMFELLHTVTFAERKGGTTVTIRTRVTKASAGAERYIGGFEAGMTQSLEKLAPRIKTVAEREFVSTRTIDAPRERLFGELSDPAQLALWWGPNGFTNTFHEFTLKPGGRWKLVMHGPDGKDYQTDKVVLEAVRPERVVLRHEQKGHNFSLTIEFIEQGDRTRITWRQLFDTVAEYAAVKHIVDGANEENLDRLVAHVGNSNGDKS